MWVRDLELLSGNIDCKRKHFVLERRRGEVIMTRKSQTHARAACSGVHCTHRETLARVCTLFIHTWVVPCHTCYGYQYY